MRKLVYYEKLKKVHCRWKRPVLCGCGLTVYHCKFFTILSIWVAENLYIRLLLINNVIGFFYLRQGIFVNRWGNNSRSWTIHGDTNSRGTSSYNGGSTDDHRFNLSSHVKLVNLFSSIYSNLLITDIYYSNYRWLRTINRNIKRIRANAFLSKLCEDMLHPSERSINLTE